MKLLLIDGNNLCYRVFWTHKQLASEIDGETVPTGLLFGFLKSLISFRKKWPDHHPIIAWDGGYSRRRMESEEGVRQGIIPSAYKATRPRGSEIPEEIQDMFSQMDELKEMLKCVQGQQVWLRGFEADDLICTYAKRNEAQGGTNIIISSDADFYQLLSDNTIIYDAMKREKWTRERFVLEFGYEPSLWVDAGAIMGEVGKSKDNIHGVDGWGPVAANEATREYGDIDEVLEAVRLKDQRDDMEKLLLAEIEKHRDDEVTFAKYVKGWLEENTERDFLIFHGMSEELADKYLTEYKTLRKALKAIRDKDGQSKSEKTMLKQEKRLRLAKSLKKMDCIYCVPEIKEREGLDSAEIKKYIDRYGFLSLANEIQYLI